MVSIGTVTVLVPFFFFWPSSVSSTSLLSFKYDSFHNLQLSTREENEKDADKGKQFKQKK